MSTEIWVALIGMIGVIGATLITAYFNNKAKNGSSVLQNPSVSISGASTASSTRQKLVIGGRQIKVADGRKTQTVNVFDATSVEGNYEQVYRITGIQHFVTKEFLQQNAPSLQALDRLMEQLGAEREGPRRAN